MEMLNEKKITWCENWLKATFAKLPEGITGIERNLLFELAEKAGLYTKNTFGSELTVALSNVGIKVKTVNDDNGEFSYHAFYI
jgi:hypothetical protein